MKHYILIRFNKGYLKNTDNPDMWLQHRIVLYHKYCLPSLEKQTNQNFEVLLLFDEKTPHHYFKQINERIIFKGFADYIDNSQWTITTRLDNDDMLYDYAVDKIQKLFEEKEMIIGGKSNIYILGGGGYYEDTTRPEKTPFISLIEAPGEKKTVYQCPHTKLTKRYKRVKLIDNYIGTHIHHKYNKGLHLEKHKGKKL